MKAIINIFIKIKTFVLDVKKQLVIKLNNFRTTSFVVAGLSVLACLVSISFLLCYEFAGEKTTSFQFTAFNERPYAGMVFFLANLISIIVGIGAAYLSFPAILNKEVIQIKKSNLLFVIGNAALQIVASVFTIILLASDEVIKTGAGFIVSLVFSIIVIIASLLMLIPYLECTFYQPKIKENK